MSDIEIIREKAEPGLQDLREELRKEQEEYDAAIAAAHRRGRVEGMEMLDKRLQALAARKWCGHGDVVLRLARSELRQVIAEQGEGSLCFANE